MKLRLRKLFERVRHRPMRWPWSKAKLENTFAGARPHRWTVHRDVALRMRSSSIDMPAHSRRSRRRGPCSRSGLAVPSEAPAKRAAGAALREQAISRRPRS